MISKIPIGFGNAWGKKKIRPLFPAFSPSLMSPMVKLLILLLAPKARFPFLPICIPFSDTVPACWFHCALVLSSVLLATPPHFVAAENVISIVSTQVTGKKMTNRTESGSDPHVTLLQTSHQVDKKLSINLLNHLWLCSGVPSSSSHVIILRTQPSGQLDQILLWHQFAFVPWLTSLVGKLLMCM